MPEQWLPVVGYEELYEVSDRGRVKALAKIDACGRSKPEIIMKQHLTGKLPSRRYALTLRKDGISKRHYVHILMLEAFVSPRPPGHLGCHIDDTPRNELSNLKWDTVSGNNYDQVRNGHNHRANRTHCKRAGHPLTDNNVAIRLVGEKKAPARICRQCEREQSRTYKLKKYGPPPQKFCACGEPISSRAKRCLSCRKAMDRKRNLNRYYQLKERATA